MSTFGADVGAIMRLELDTVSKLVLVAIRYHGDSEGRCDVSGRKVAEMAGVSRSTMCQRVAKLVSAGFLTVVSEVGSPSVYVVTIDPRVRETDTPPVRHTDTPCPGAGQVPHTP